MAARGSRQASWMWCCLARRSLHSSRLGWKGVSCRCVPVEADCSDADVTRAATTHSGLQGVGPHARHAWYQALHDTGAPRQQMHLFHNAPNHNHILSHQQAHRLRPLFYACSLGGLPLPLAGAASQGSACPDRNLTVHRLGTPTPEIRLAPRRLWNAWPESPSSRWPPSPRC